MQGFAIVLALEDFKHFVYVLSVLERYPDQPCAVLLGPSVEEILDTRIRALEHIADFTNRESVRQVEAIPDVKTPVLIQQSLE